MSSTNSKDIRAFRALVWKYYKEEGRHDLPWRKTTDPYKILVSEVMLQQTQVPRVLEKYKEFIRAFPTVRKLAAASLSDVVKVWSGLGYNRRAKYLSDAARSIVAEHQGVMPRDYPTLRAIPGIGMYTANAVRVFAFNEPEVLLETNVRTAIMHHFLNEKTKIEDYRIEKIAAAAAEGQDPRRWHSALFDYGAYLKRSGIRNNVQSKHYTKQSTFEGSLRQLRGAILRQLHEGPRNERALWYKVQPCTTERIEAALKGLAKDGLIRREKNKWQIA
jgi:A/G-specific adenine glycosylase